jgi:hypothetical protein
VDDGATARDNSSGSAWGLRRVLVRERSLLLVVLHDMDPAASMDAPIRRRATVSALPQDR